jgi:hypothetical protein
MKIENLKRVVLVTKTTIEIVLCRNASALLAVSLFLMSLPMAHAVGHQAWDGTDFATWPALVDIGQILVGYLFTLVVTGNTFLLYRMLRPLWRLLTYALRIWRACFKAGAAVTFVAADYMHDK